MSELCPPRVAIYVCHATRNRLPALRRYAQEHGWTVAGEYVDFRLGGESLNRMIAAAHSGEHDGLLLWQRRRQPEFRRGLINGGSEAYAVIDAPNANISFSGGSNFRISTGR